MAQVKEPLYHYVAEREGATTANYQRIFNDHSAVYGLLKEFMVSHHLWRSHRKYFDKRLIRSLLHHVNRLQKNATLSANAKEEMIKGALGKSVRYLQHPEKIVHYPLNQTKKSLWKYRLHLGIITL